MPSPETIETIRRKLATGLSPSRLEIVDESPFHAGHAGARGGGGHYAVTVVSEAFTGLPPIQRHRLIHRILAEEMRREIHALAITALDPSEAGERAGEPGSGPR